MSTYPCAGCGAGVEYAPGTTAMRCPYCGHQQQIEMPTRQVMEHSFAGLTGRPRVPAAELAAHRYVCQKCGAHTQGDALATRCQFCASALVAAADDDKQIAPEAILPFAIDKQAAREAVRKWVKSRWFAPGSLKRVNDAESMRSTYLPFWTYDSNTTTAYVGQRGDHYYTTETYKDSEGKTQTRQVRHTRWSPASGTVARRFDDVLIPATRHVPPARLTKLDPWPLPQAVAYDASFAAGHQALRYDLEPEQGFEQAKEVMAKTIEDDCRRDIGGDEQRVQNMNTRHADVTFKHMLLPVWSGAYLHSGKTYQVLVNGISAEVQGDRPYSAAKIVLAVMVALALIVALLLVLNLGG